jgi:NAD(P)-dependent dehydrogenase (short-subunit alcohol dehydrogenase family)
MLQGSKIIVIGGGSGIGRAAVVPMGRVGNHGSESARGWRAGRKQDDPHTRQELGRQDH